MLLTPSSFIWVFQILIGYSKFLEMLICVFCFFQLGIFVDVKIFHDITVRFRHIHSRMEATLGFDFRDVYSR